MRLRDTFNIVVLMAFAALVTTSCRKGKSSYDTIGESGLTTRTENLRTNLLPYQSKGVMIGQAYGVTEGIGWMGDSARSDIYEISNDWPACIGYDLTGIESGDKLGLDSVPFSLVRKGIIDYFHRQGLVVLSWTIPDYGNSDKKLKAYVKNVETYISSLHDDYGIKVPVVLIINPLREGVWYFNMQAEMYKKLYSKIVKMLRDEGLTNAIFAFSNTNWKAQTADEWGAYCPIDDVDVVQLDYVADDNNVFEKYFLHTVNVASAYASEHTKAFGLYAGLRGIGDDNFWTKNILPVVQNCRMSYLMLGSNHGDAKNGNFYAPYPGQTSVADFMKLYNDPRSLFMSKVNGLILDHSQKENKKQ